MSLFSIAQSLKQAQLDYPAIPGMECRLLLQHLLNVDRAWLIAHENDALGANIHAEFQALLRRRLCGEPLAYIVGYREFYGLKLKVTPDTLIPRADTETLVEAALEKLSLRPFPHGDGMLKVLDLGTGSGAIALAIAKHRPQVQVIAVDASEKALSVAQENAKVLNIPNVLFMHSDWFGALEGMTFDVIAGNPPYIEDNDPHLQLEDLRFEPIMALTAGKDGLNDLRAIISEAMNYLKPQGWLMLEHGYNQARKVRDLMHEAGFAEVDHKYDLAGIERVTFGRGARPMLVGTTGLQAIV